MSADIYATIDLGGTKIAGALARADGTIIVEKTIPTHSHLGPPGVADRIAALVRDLAAQAGQPPRALGVGVPGLIDLAQGIVHFAPNLTTNWRGVPLRQWLEPQLGCPVALLNDARMAALGELTYGRARGIDTMVFVTIGTGVGGAVVVDGRLRLGPLGAAGELGHQTIVADGPVCGCGNRGCLEALASGPAIAASGVWLMQCGRAPRLYDLVEGDAGRVTPGTMMQAAQAGDDSVKMAMVRAFEYIGISVANTVTILHPDMVILTGSVAQVGDLLFETVHHTVQTRVGMFPPANVRIERSLLDGRAGLLGGIALAQQAAAR